MHKRAKLFVCVPITFSLMVGHAASAAGHNTEDVKAAAQIAIAIAEHGGDAVNFVSRKLNWGNGHGAYHNVTWSGPFVEIDSATNEERYFFRVRSDARGRDPNSGSATIPVAQFFETFDPATAFLVVEGNEVKHSDRIRGEPVTRHMKSSLGNVVLSHKVNFRARWGGWNTAFPSSRVYIPGELKPAYREVATECVRGRGAALRCSAVRQIGGISPTVHSPARLPDQECARELVSSGRASQLPALRLRLPT